MSSLFFEKGMNFKNNTLKLSLAGIMVLINVIYALFLFLIIYPSGILNIIEIATKGIISVTFVIYIPLNLLNVLFFLIIAKMTFHELGLSWKNLWQGILIIIGIWVTTELIMLINNLAFNITPLISNYWLTPGVAATTIGSFLQEFLGNSLFEEVVYRGVLIPQMFIIFQRKEVIKNDALAWFLSVLITQIVFALIHIPSRIIAFGMAPLDLLINLLLLLGLGAVFAITFLCTRNLVVSIGVHALSNIGLPLFTHLNFTFVIFLGMALVVSIVIFVIRYVKERKELKADLEATEDSAGIPESTFTEDHSSSNIDNPQ